MLLHRILCVKNKFLIDQIAGKIEKIFDSELTNI